MNSYITSFFGILSAIGGAVITAIQTGIIAPDTLPAWVKGVAGLMSVIGLAGLGIAARDNGKSSEDVGVKPTSIAASVLRSGGGQGGFACVKMLFLVFLCSIVAFHLVGCARVTVTRDGFTALTPAWPWQDSTRVIDRLNVSSKTNSFTASVRGLNEAETTSTNTVELMRSVAEGLMTGAVKAAAK